LQICNGASHIIDFASSFYGTLRNNININIKLVSHLFSHMVLTRRWCNV